jgi:hypothetical protein
VSSLEVEQKHTNPSAVNFQQQAQEKHDKQEKKKEATCDN